MDQRHQSPCPQGENRKHPHKDPQPLPMTLEGIKPNRYAKGEKQGGTYQYREILEVDSEVYVHHTQPQGDDSDDRKTPYDGPRRSVHKVGPRLSGNSASTVTRVSGTRAIIPTPASVSVPCRLFSARSFILSSALSRNRSSKRLRANSGGMSG